MADFTATSFIYGVVYNDAFPMQEWAKEGQAIFEKHHDAKVYKERVG